MFIKCKDETLTIVAVYIDDLLLLSNSTSAVERVKGELK
jgi:hypothetical protein